MMDDFAIAAACFLLGAVVTITAPVWLLGLVASYGLVRDILHGLSAAVTSWVAFKAGFVEPGTMWRRNDGLGYLIVVDVVCTSENLGVETNDQTRLPIKHPWSKIHGLGDGHILRREWYAPAVSPTFYAQRVSDDEALRALIAEQTARAKARAEIEALRGFSGDDLSWLDAP